MSGMPEFFSTIARELGERTARATVSQLGPASTALLRHLQARLEQQVGRPGGYLGTPVFEAMFGWPEYSQTMAELTKGEDRLLESALVSAMDAPPADCIEQRFGKDWRPYVHQVEAWKALATDPPKSVVVSTGTGSGKTECFLIPILNDLVRRANAQTDPLRGVHALFLYPLNALINSQRDRLRAWTAPFGGKLRFALYNGTTPETVPGANQQRRPEQTLSRRLIREAPPPILVTNAVMLEFMLVRAKDRPIIDQSQGKLRWIVLDEAHTYVGSQAAEIALLLRRVLHNFGSDAKDVRFIATSATIGGADESERLADYMANLAGVERSRVVVVTGKRRVPDLPQELRSAKYALPAAAQLEAMSPAQRFVALGSVPVVRRIRDALTEGPKTLANLAVQANEVDPSIAADDQPAVLSVLDAATSAKNDADEPLLPVRGHFFVRTQGGLWGCSNSSCGARNGTELADPSWKFGRLFFEHREKCDACESRVFEVVFCNGCGAEYMACAEIVDDSNARVLVPSPAATWSEEDGDEEEGDDTEEEGEDGAARGTLLRRLIEGGSSISAAASDGATPERPFDPKTGALDGAEPATVRLLMPEADVMRIRCRRCGQREPESRDLFRPLRLGAPFFLGVTIPAVLEHVPEAEKDKKPEILPLRGRRLITFTDSRQGTARFATKAQIESERNYVRSMLYHSLWERVKPPSAEELERSRNRLKAFEAAGLDVEVANERAKLDALQAASENPQGRVSWKEMRERLHDQRAIREWITQSQRMRYLPANLTPGDIASLSLLREFARRPKRQNSVETLGLVALEYPFLAEIGSTPREWSRRGRTLPEWRSFLKVAVDFVLRTFTAIVMPIDYSRWMGTNIAPKKIVGPGGTTVRNKVYAWPVLRDGVAPPRMAKLLERALGLNLGDKDDRADIDVMLRVAWEQIQPFLQKDQAGYALDLSERAVLTTVGSAFVCPVTRRVLDTTLLGVSPYQTDRWGGGTATCATIDMPRPRVVFPQNDTERAAIAEFLGKDERVLTARQRGTWTEFSDRIAQFVEYIELGEHSAQQSPPRLRELETGFKGGRVNVLSCSTTMEMGVDIGGIAAVAMNNAPPGPANFLQRAGRAGRRKETRALSLTLCQNQPHGEAVFENPLWPFTTPIQVPTVSLSSERIVMRHVASLALAAFLRLFNDDALRLTTEWFFVAPDTSTKSRAEQFIAWCSEVAPEDAALSTGVRRLVQKSNLALTDTRVLFEETAVRLVPVLEEWTGQRQLLLESLTLARGERSDSEPPRVEELAVQQLLLRHHGEYLLKMLASSGFLPAYGFPVGVLPFVNTTAEYLKAEKKGRERKRAEGEEGSDRDDVVWKRSFPSRELAMAIREYAPGSAVIINGMVYEPGGVTLNWRLPPGDEAERNPQELRWAWECKRCGMHGSTPTQPSTCKRCGAETLLRFRFIRPAGFAVDIRFQPHNDVTQQRFVPLEDPWISAGDASWQALPRAEAGRYRYHPEGSVLYWNAGPNRPYGYAICLRCGRAAAENGWSNECDIPPEMDGHKPLRSSRDGDLDGLCVGNAPSRAIQRNLRLAGEAVTDVVQLQLSDAETGQPLADKIQASSIAVALRTATARNLGIDEREIGWVASLDKSEQDGTRATITLFDTAGGGAGYVARVPSQLAALLRDAASILDCPRGCDRACHGCLLSFDTQHCVEELDRHAARAFLTDKFLLSLALPAELRVFGEDTQLEYSDLTTAIVRTLGQAASSEVRIYLGGEAKDWDRPAWTLSRALVAFVTSSSNRTARIFLPKKVLADMQWDEANDWADWANGRGVQLQSYERATADAGAAWLAAEVFGGTRVERFALLDPDSLAPGEVWGAASSSERCLRVTKAIDVVPAPSGVPLDAAKLRRPTPKDRQLVLIKNQADGAVAQVGERILQAIASDVPIAKDRLGMKELATSIVYCDRYLRSPLTVRLAYELLRALRDRFGLVGAATEVRVRTSTPRRNDRPGAPYSLKHDWRDPTTQRAVLEAVVAGVTPGATVAIQEYDELPHDRELSITWSGDRTLTLAFDQGVGFLEPASSVAHAFDRAAKEQAARLLQSSFVVRAASKLPTKIYVGCQ